MNCTLFAAFALWSASVPVLLDSAVKATALLTLATVAAMMLRRDSAATRHLVWLLAIVAVLAVPALSAMLPEWRVLPDWASIRPSAATATNPLPVAAPADGLAQSPPIVSFQEIELPSTPARQPVAGPPILPPTLAASEIAPEPAVWSWDWHDALPLVWAVGFCVLVLRLVAARWMLWSTERQATVLSSSSQTAEASHDPIVTAFQAACSQLGISRPVTLLVHPDKKVPAVWGVLRPRLLLPATARHWSGEQLQSVLLHELAHVKRRDLMGQLLSQLACALYWFHPLVWFAAWRLGVERERACDDLVLAGGVRPSAYAEHLLDVATHLSPVHWTKACGLVMARRPSLEGRLVAVLCENLNRRSVSAAFVALALAIAVGIAVPIAMLRAAEKKPTAPVQPQEVQKPKDGEKLQPGLEEKLQWGQPANGLRAALLIRPVPGKSKDDDMPDLYLVVQNMTEAPIHFHDTTAAKKLRELYTKIDGIPVSGTVVQEPTGADVMLQPREVALLLMFPPDSKFSNGRAVGSVRAENALKDTRQTLFAELQIENAPAGAWTGKLVTGDTSGATAAGQPQPKGGEKLDPRIEDRLRWGEPAAGLRAALAIRPARGMPKPGDLPDLYLVVQNVSIAPIRLIDTTSEPKFRKVYLKRDGRILFGLTSKEPTGLDVVLQPREVAFLLVFTQSLKNQDGSTAEPMWAENLLKDPHQTMVGELQSEKAPAGAWTGKLRTGETSGDAAGDKPLPKDGLAQTLFRQWQANARTDGKFPGALIGKLSAKVRYFISLNKEDSPTNRELALKFERLLPRLDASHDWTQSDAIAILDDISAINTIPLETTLGSADENSIRTGAPLPADLADAPWGRPSPDGLRVAWLLEPRAKQYPLGTSLRSRILVHNSGKKAALFIMPSWQQSAKHTAHDAKGAPLDVTSTYWTTVARRMTYRLAPGEYCETPAAGIGVGAKTEGVGAWINAKQGDQVRFSPGPVEVRCSPSVMGTTIEDGHPTNVDPKDAADLWERIIAERVQRELPLPAAASERTQILRRVTHDLFGGSPTPEEVAALVADNSPTAQASLVKRLLHRPGIAPFTGTLTSGDIQFHVLPADANAAKKPRVATSRNAPSEPPASVSPSPVPRKKETTAEAAALSLADVVKAINEQAAKLPETRGLKPLTEDEVVEAIEKFQRPAPTPGEEDSHLKTLTDDEFRTIKSVAQTRRLPAGLIVRQFVRYDVGTGIEHGWWVRLNLKRDGASPTVALRQDVLLARPYTQLERQFRDDIRRTGRIPTMGRTMVYFDEAPQVGAQRKFSAAAAKRLADAVKQAIDNAKADELLKLYCWDKVDAKARKRVENDAESLVKRKLASVAVRPRGFGGRLTHWEGFAYWDPNLPLAGYIVLEFADPQEPRSVCLEFGETAEGTRLASYFISQDDAPKLIGKPMSRSFQVTGFTTFHPDRGWPEFVSELDTPPEEIPALKQINFEIWKVQAKR